MKNKVPRSDVFAAINIERRHQIGKYGDDRKQSVAGFILIAEAELAEAKHAWLRSVSDGRNSCMAEICQVAATCVAAMEKYGVTGTPTPGDDEPPDALSSGDDPMVPDPLVLRNNMTFREVIHTIAQRVPFGRRAGGFYYEEVELLDVQKNQIDRIGRLYEGQQSMASIAANLRTPHPGEGRLIIATSYLRSKGIAYVVRGEKA